MASFNRLAVLAALLASSASIVGAVAASGSVKTCDINDKPLANGVTEQSGCTGGNSFMCSDQSPWAINANLAYGFAAVTASNPTCCQCYKLTFTSDGPIKGKTMIVQATNTGNDVSGTQFDLAIPGGGFGQFDGCSKEWKATSDVWGAQYGGSNTNQCSNFPAALQNGCGFRWDWMGGQSNPNVDYETVACPAEIVAKSGCSVSGYSAPASPQQPSTSKSPAIQPRTTTTQKASAPTPTKKASDSYSAAGENSSVDVEDSPATVSMADGDVSEPTSTSSAMKAGPTGDVDVEESVVEEPVVEEPVEDDEQGEDDDDDTCDA
ncbi:MAG: hypothetical protein L6R42_004584 [Xanthoria sp. 1 TBL-2021]|nr:MAG: hypothetical protein L6R42_004584 [Xanthoria sp. 1 TBL-2021]